MITGPLIVAISGPAGAGKDTAAAALTEPLTDGLEMPWAIRIGLADRLKHVATDLGWDGSKDPRGRGFLIALGDAIRSYDRGYFPRYLCDLATQKYRQSGFAAQRWRMLVAVPDIRYYDEWDAFHSYVEEMGGALLNLHVDRSETPEMARVRHHHGTHATESQMALHPRNRERPVESFQTMHSSLAVVYNTGTIVQFKHQVRGAVLSWLGDLKAR